MKWHYVLSLLLLFSMLAPVARAQTVEQPTIIISEINWAGSNISRADEWIELYNPNGESLDLSGWILAGSATNGQAISLPAGTVIEGEKPLLIANYALESEKTTLAAEPDLVTSALALSNTEFTIFLTTPEGLVVDRAERDAGKSNPSTSMERNLATLEWMDATASLNLSDTTQFGTPGYVLLTQNTDEDSPITDPCQTPTTSSEEQTDPSESEDTPIEDTSPETSPETDEKEQVTLYQTGNILLNELVSDPEDGTEWIELYNPGSQPIDLNGWQIQDAAEHVTELSGTILAEGYVIVEEPKGKLNNSAETISLLDPYLTATDQVSYDAGTAPSKGESLARDEDGRWITTTIITKGSENQFPNEDSDGEQNEELLLDPEQNEPEAQEQVSSTTDAEAVSTEQDAQQIIAVAMPPQASDEGRESSSRRETSSKTTAQVTYSGVITAAPGIFGKQIAFMEGIQLYFYHADWPELTEGDVVHVTGTTSTSRGEPRLKIASAEDIQITGSQELEVRTVSIASLSEADEGALVRIEGNIVQRDGNKLEIEDDTGSLTAIAHASAGTSWKQLSSARLSLTGVVRAIDGEIRLYPRSMDDIEEQPQEGGVETEDSVTSEASTTRDARSASPWIGGGLLLSTGSTLGYWFFRHRRFI